MSEKFISFPRLARKGFHVSIPLMDEATWKRFATQDPTIPRTFARLREYGRLLYGPRPRKFPRMVRQQPSVGSIRSLYEECGEAAWQRFFLGLGNPNLTPAQRDGIEADMDADMPDFDLSIDTDHFILRWTNSSAHAADNIADNRIVSGTGEHLEEAWNIYEAAFGRPPYVPVNSDKIEVVFYDIGGPNGVASPPDGPIQLNSVSWVTTEGLHKPVSAHELFHKLQYAFGYRTSWNLVEPYLWFSEGTASWAEVFIWQRVSRDTKITRMFTNPDLNLYDASYSALPFWIFFEARQRSDAEDNPILHYLSTIEPNGDIEGALEEVIDEEWAANNVFGQLDTFYALFARDRHIGHWRSGPLGGFYPSILAPDDTEVTPDLRVTQVALGLSDTYTANESVSPLGSDYYRFSLEADADGQLFSLSVDGERGGDFSYYLIWEKDGSWMNAAFSSVSSGAFSHAEGVNLTNADAVVLVVSGRGAGGNYTLNTSVQGIWVRVQDHRPGRPLIEQVRPPLA